MRNGHLLQEVIIQIGDKSLPGELYLPRKANNIIIFSHGSGSSRFSSRNRQVAEYLQKRNFGTLLFDLLTAAEDQHFQNRFNIELLTKRLVGAAEWLERLPAANNCRIGFFGASTGAASALQAAAILPRVYAVVSRGGRPDLASRQALKQVKAAVLLIVGSNDEQVITLNTQAYKELECRKELAIVEGASHLFEEPGKLEEVARLAAAWFDTLTIGEAGKNGKV